MNINFVKFAMKINKKNKKENAYFLRRTFPLTNEKEKKSVL